MEPFRLTISQRQLELLDWPLIQKRITQGCFFEHNKRKFESCPFLKSHLIEQEHEILERIFLNLNDLKQSLLTSLQGCPTAEDLFSQMSMLKKGKVLVPESANLAAHLIEVYEVVSRLIDPSVVGISKDLELKVLVKDFLKPLRKFVDRNGQVHYEKHPKLAKIAQEIHSTSSQLRRQIQDLIKSETYSQAIQFEQYDIIDDRYVLPIRSDHYQAHLGLIVSRSQSGMTLLVEPPTLRDLANKRMQLLAKQEEVLNQIFVELSHNLTENYYSFKNIIYFNERLDLLISKASFCDEYRLTRPEMTSQKSIHIKSFFHPLIEKPIVNDLSLDESASGIVISGPNTGGKTVALKSLALCQVLLHSGLFLPAEKAQLPLASAVYYFSHDQQDLSQGLSSFSSEAAQYIELVENLKDNSFIFIDEIFNSTSSEEASALALGLLDYIHQKKDVRVFLSTHHQFLKTAMHSNSRYLSCHVGYDFQNNTPTYKLQYNSPGSSLALSIFKKLTVSSSYNLESIYQKAQNYLDKKQVSYEGLLEKLSSQKTELDKKIQETNTLKQELHNQKKSSEGILFLERDKLKSEYKQKLEKTFEDAKSWVFNFQAELKENQNTKKAFTKLDKQKVKQFASLNDTQELPPALKTTPDTTNINLEDIYEGGEFFCHLTGTQVIVSKINPRKKQVQIKNKGINFWVPLKSLSMTNQKPMKKEQEVKVTVTKSERGQLEIDGRGLRLDEFQQEVLPSLDELLCGDIPYLTVIHGHGDGILKKWLRDHLSKSDRDFSWGPDEGNDGSTTIKLLS